MKDSLFVIIGFAGGLLLGGFFHYLLYRVGDAASSRNVHAAIFDALRLCKDL